MKRILALVTSATLLFTLVGCSSQQPSSGGQTTADVATTAAKVDAETSAEGGGQTSDDLETVKLGGCFVMTGGGSAANLDWVLPAVEMAVEEYNESPDKKFNLELVTRDCQNDTSLIAEKYSELKTEGCVAIVGPNGSTHGVAGLEWAEANEIPVIVTSSLMGTAIAAATNKWGFTGGYMGLNVGRVLAKQFIEQGDHSCYVFGGDAADGYETRDAFFEYLDEQGYEYEIQGEAWVSTSNGDFSSVANAAMVGNPDAIILINSASPCLSFLQQGQMYGMLDQCHIYTHLGLGSDVTQPFGDEFPDGVISFDYASWNDDSAENAVYHDWATKFYDRTGVWPSNFSIGFVVGAYSLIQAIDAAYDVDAKTVSEEDIASNLESMTFDTPIGDVYFTSLEAGHGAYYGGTLVSSVYSEEYGLSYGKVLGRVGDEILLTPDELAVKIAEARAAK